jgi:hypothetical protein
MSCTTTFLLAHHPGAVPSHEHGRLRLHLALLCEDHTNGWTTHSGRAEEAKKER